jgi:type II secretory pathway pseudopilin PulG
MKLQHLLKTKNGMTLVEVVVSFAIVAIVGIMVLAALMTSANAKIKGDAFTLADEQLSEAIAEGATADTTTPNDLSVNVGPDKTIIIPGKAYTYDDEEYGKTFRIVGR